MSFQISMSKPVKVSKFFFPALSVNGYDHLTVLFRNVPSGILAQMTLKGTEPSSGLQEQPFEFEPIILQSGDAGAIFDVEHMREVQGYELSLSQRDLTSMVFQPNVVLIRPEEQGIPVVDPSGVTLDVEGYVRTVRAQKIPDCFVDESGAVEIEGFDLASGWVPSSGVFPPAQPGLVIEADDYYVNLSGAPGSVSASGSYGFPTYAFAIEKDYGSSPLDVSESKILMIDVSALTSSTGASDVPDDLTFSMFVEDSEGNSFLFPNVGSGLKAGFQPLEVPLFESWLGTNISGIKRLGLSVFSAVPASGTRLRVNFDRLRRTNIVDPVDCVSTALGLPAPAKQFDLFEGFEGAVAWAALDRPTGADPSGTTVVSSTPTASQGIAARRIASMIGAGEFGASASYSPPTSIRQANTFALDVFPVSGTVDVRMEFQDSASGVLHTRTQRLTPGGAFEEVRFDVEFGGHFIDLDAIEDVRVIVDPVGAGPHEVIVDNLQESSLRTFLAGWYAT